MMTDILTYEPDQVPPVAFTYSHPDQSLFRRTLIRGIELVTGQMRMRRLYRDWALCGKRPGESVFDAALRLLAIPPLVQDPHHLMSVPRQGGLLIVANHPFGIVDGLAIGHLGMRLRGNVRILTNSLLCRVPEADPHLLPVDFSDSAEARRLTGETRKRAAALLTAGKVVAIFPAGNVATANDPVRGRAVEAAWHPFVGRLALLPGVTILPVHFSGQNSRLFQIASHLSYPVRIALIFRETRRRRGRPVSMTIGAPVFSDDLRQMDRSAVTDRLRRCTLDLAHPALPDPGAVFEWPAHIRW